MPVLRDVVGHEQVKKRLKNALTGRVNHAYLFGGPPGVGKKPPVLPLPGRYCASGARGMPAGNVMTVPSRSEVCIPICTLSVRKVLP